MFYIHPTSYRERARWNAPIDDKIANDRAALFLRGQATAFNDSAAIWAPRYRQATFGAFLTGQKEAQLALDLAYGDVAAAFDSFVTQIDPDRPIILAGHSQGALHLLRLLKDQVAGTPLQARVAAVYLVGWPVSVTADLPALGLPACTARAQAGCILSWQSFAEPADPEAVLAVYDAGTGLNGTPRRGTAILCTNPLTGGVGGSAPASANPGSLVPSASLENGALVTPGVPARCDNRGLLLIGEAPSGYPAYVLPGNNFHVFDYPLFWQAVRLDVAARVQAWQATREAGR
jgi:hypothetical protein